MIGNGRASVFHKRNLNSGECFGEFECEREITRMYLDLNTDTLHFDERLPYTTSHPCFFSSSVEREMVMCYRARSAYHKKLYKLI